MMKEKGVVRVKAEPDIQVKLEPDVKPKLDPYEKRKREAFGVAAPIEEDSDSDFRAGPVEIEETKPKKRSRKQTSESRPKKKRKGNSDDEWAVDLSVKVASTMSSSTKRKKPKFNPLAKYFMGPTNGLEYMSGDDEADDEKLLDDDDEEEMESEGESSHASKTMQSYLTAALKTTPSNTPSLQRESQGEPSIHSQPDGIVVDSQTEDDEPEILPEQDSSTEDDSEDPETKIPSCRTQPSFQSGIQRQDSVTEDDDDEPKPRVDSSSSTEDDDDDVPQINPRPSFQRPPPVSLQPLILDNEKNIKVPLTLNLFLRDYQREGIQFFYRRYAENSGGLLGDDMGLVRKTVQVIGFLSAIMKKTGYQCDEERRQNHVRALQDLPSWKKHKTVPPADATWPTCLIIAPSSVVHNWERELQTWGWFEVGIYTGPPDVRKRALREFTLGRLDIVLTSFEIASRDIELLNTLPWTCIFIDEVHRVKNLKSKLSEAFHTFTCRRRFGLTGTAIQNSYDELHAILHWSDPKELGPARFWKRSVSEPLKIGQSNTATDDERAKALATSIILRDEFLPRFFLRRTKDLISHQMPTKTDNVVFCPLAPIQLAAYKRILAIPEVQDLIHMDDPCECGSGKLTKKCCAPYIAANMLRYMSVLIALSNHVGLILPSDTQTPEQLERSRALTQMAFPDNSAPNRLQVMFDPEYCGKWKVLNSLLAEWRAEGSNKVLIFTKSVQLLKMLELHLNSQSYQYLSFSGETAQKDRMGLIDEFQSDPDIFVFLISTLAGGTGLNLTAANKVVIFDPNWNPAHDLQAMDRAYRIGQTRPVSVYRLLGAGALEELIYACQLYKQQQMAIGYDASVQTPYFEGVKNSAKRGELFGVKNIFRLQHDRLATKNTIEQANYAQLDWAFSNIDSKDDPENLAGLDNLLLDPSSGPQGGKKEKDQTELEIERQLKLIGVNYTHKNDEVLKESDIELRKAKATLKKMQKMPRLSGERAPRRQSVNRPSGNGIDDVDDQPRAQWPPVRSHHQPKLTPQEQCDRRWEALVDRGYIDSPADIKDKVVPMFIKMNGQEQRAFLTDLDNHIRRKKKREKQEAERRAQEDSN